MTIFIPRLLTFELDLVVWGFLCWSQMLHCMQRCGPPHAVSYFAHAGMRNCTMTTAVPWKWAVKYAGNDNHSPCLHPKTLCMKMNSHGIYDSPNVHTDVYSVLGKGAVRRYFLLCPPWQLSTLHVRVPRTRRSMQCSWLKSGFWLLFYSDLSLTLSLSLFHIGWSAAVTC